MTTKQLIEKLKEIDPSGDLEVMLEGCFYGCEVEEVVKKHYVDPDTKEVTSYWIEIC